MSDQSDASAGRWGPPAGDEPPAPRDADQTQGSFQAYAPPSAPSGLEPPTVRLPGPPAYGESEEPRLPPAAPQAAFPPPGSAPSEPRLAASEMEFEAPPAAPRKRSKVALAGAVAGVLALGTAGTFAVTEMTGDDSAGGAATPEEVGEAMLTSLENEDVLGMMDLLLPGERETFREPMVDMVAELSRMEVLASDTDLGGLAGVDVEVVESDVRVDRTNVDDIANIEMRADLTVSIDGDALPVGDLILDTVADLEGQPPDMSALDVDAEPTAFTLPMTVVQDDGRWYLSMMYTLAELARNESGGQPIPVKGVDARGGDNPEGAVDVLLAGVESLDLAAVIGALNPDEAQALQRYAPLFIDDAQAALDEVPLRWRVVDTDYSVTGSGDKRFVAIDVVQIDGDVDGIVFSARLDNGCLRLQAEGETFDTCELLGEHGGESPSLEELFGDDGAVLQDVFTSLEETFADYAPPGGITVREVDGQWFVSPIGSGFDQLLALFGAIDRDEIDAIIDQIGNAAVAFDSLSGGVVSDGLDGGLPAVIDDDSVNAAPWPDDTATDTDADTDVDTGDETGADGGIDATGQLDEAALVETCYAAPTTDEVISCIEAAVVAGELSPYYLTAELRHPECGVADLVTGKVALSQLSDEEYTAIVERAADCFGALIASGELNEPEVSPEYVQPECAAGRNPYRFDAEDSDEFFDAWLDCVFGF